MIIVPAIGPDPSLRTTGQLLNSIGPTSVRSRPVI